MPWPSAVGEFQHQQAIGLARRPQRSTRMIEMHLRRAPVGTAGDPPAWTHVVRSGCGRRRAGRIVISDLLGIQGIADIEHPYARIEITTGERRRMVLVVDAAVVTSIGERR